MIRAIVKWIVSCRLIIAFTEHLLPKIRITWGHTRMTGRKYRKGYALLQTGHILVTADENRLSTYLTPGDWAAHAALCVDKGSADFEIGEMHAEGFNKTTFFDLCHTSDRVCILSCDAWDSDYIGTVVAVCKSLDPTPYDFVFGQGFKELYCSELIVACDPEGRLQHLTSDTLLGPVVTPQDILKSKNVTTVWDSDE